MINKFQQGGQAQQMMQQFIMDISQATGAQPEQVMQLVQQVAQQDKNRLAQAMQMWQNQDIKGAVQTLTGQQMARKGAKLNYLKRISNTCPEGTQLTYYKVGGQICSKCEAMAQQKAMNIMDNIKTEMFMGGGNFQDSNKKKKAPVKKANSEGTGSFDKYGNYVLDKKKTEEHAKKMDANKTKEQTNVPNINKGIRKNSEGTKISAKACPKCGKVHAGKCGSKLMKKKKKCACGAKVQDPKKAACGVKIKENKCGSKMKKKHQLGGILEAIKKLQISK